MAKLIYNKWIPFKGFVAINIFGLIFARAEYKRAIETNPKIKREVVNHESIHTEQYKETLFVLFLPLYLINYVINLMIYFNLDKAYRNICFEREAFEFENDLEYLDKRKPFEWIKRVFK